MKTDVENAGDLALEIEVAWWSRVRFYVDILVGKRPNWEVT